MGWGGLPLPACRGALQGLVRHAVCVGLLWALVAAPALAQGLSAEADALAPHLLTVPGEAMLIDPPPPPPLPPPGVDASSLGLATADEVGLASWYGAQFHRDRKSVV